MLGLLYKAGRGQRASGRAGGGRELSRALLFSGAQLETGAVLAGVEAEGRKDGVKKKEPVRTGR